MPPLWKIRREVLRLVTSVIMAPRNLLWYFGATRYYDHRLAQEKQEFEGQISLRDRVAVFVIYPAGGLAKSALLTLDHIHQSGYSAIVVSNLPLEDKDREAILARCSKYIERPNFGYDFGAYRDGILSIADQLPTLNRLVMLNDSAWYPLPNGTNWLNEAEALGLDFVGATSNYGTPRIKPESFQDQVWNYSTKHRNFHYCSFALSIGPKVLQDQAFAKFWSRFAIDNAKTRVVRRGEIGLSRWIIKQGFSHGCTCNPAELDKILNQLDDDRLLELCNNLIFAEHDRGLQKKLELLPALNQKAPDWRNTAHRLVLLAASVQGLSYSLADLTTKELNFPFLKKSPLRLSRDGSDCSMRLIDALPGPMGEAIRQEAAQLRKDLPK